MVTYALSVLVLRRRFSYRNIEGSAEVYSTDQKWSFERYSRAREVAHLVCIELPVCSEASRTSSYDTLYCLDALDWPIPLADGV